MIGKIQEKYFQISLENSIMLVFAVAYMLFVFHQTHILDTIKNHKKIVLIDDYEEKTLVEDEVKPFDSSLNDTFLAFTSKKIYSDKDKKSTSNCLVEKYYNFSKEIPFPPPQII